MKEAVNVAVMQFAPEPLDLVRNIDSMVGAVRHEAARHQTDMVVFPELSTTGYIPPAFDQQFRALLAEQSDTVPGHATKALAEVARRTSTYVAAGMCECDERGTLFNSMVLISAQGDLLGVHRKVHLWQQEPNYFSPGDKFDVIPTDLGQIGMSICYDSKFPEASRSQALRGAEILICIFAYTSDPGVPRDILTHRAVIRAWENSAFYVLANRLGLQPAGEFVGGSVVAGPLGQILTADHGPRDSVVRARLLSQSLLDARGSSDFRLERRPDAYGTREPVAPGRNTSPTMEAL
jgi:predicted amidohydrolase